MSYPRLRNAYIGRHLVVLVAFRVGDGGGRLLMLRSLPAMVERMCGGRRALSPPMAVGRLDSGSGPVPRSGVVTRGVRWEVIEEEEACSRRPFLPRSWVGATPGVRRRTVSVTGHER